MDIDDLLSPYRGFTPPATDEAGPGTRGSEVGDERRDRTAGDLPSPESWHMYDFVRRLRG